MVSVSQRPAQASPTPPGQTAQAPVYGRNVLVTVTKQSGDFQSRPYSGRFLQNPATQTTTPASLIGLQNITNQFATQLKALPDLSAGLRSAFVEAVKSSGHPSDDLGSGGLSVSTPAIQTHIKPLLTDLLASAQNAADGFWSPSRLNTFSSLLAMELREEVSLKITDNLLEASDKQLMEAALDPESNPAPLRHALLLGDTALAGAFVIVDRLSGRHLLYVPGFGLEGFPSRQALFKTLASYLDAPLERTALLSTLPIDERASHIDLDNALDPALPWSLTPVTQPLLSHMLDAFRKKQRDDLAGSFVLPAPGTNGARIDAWLEGLRDATLPGPFGSEGMLDRRDRALLQRAAYEQLPDWLKTASPEQHAEYAQRLKNWRTSLSELSQIETAASSAGYVRNVVQTQIITDLGYELDPDQLTVSTERFVPVNGDTYVQNRSLTELAVNGLQTGDERSGADFIRNSTITYQGKPLDTTLSQLTPTYLTQLIASLPTPGQQRVAQQALYSPQILRKVADQRLLAHAYGAQISGDILADDQRAIERLSQSDKGSLPLDSQISTLKLGGYPLKDLLVVSHGEGMTQRWLLFTPGAPREQQWQSFSSQRQLIQAIVQWSADSAMSAWLVQQASPRARAELTGLLAELSVKPFPAADFLGFVSHRTYSAALDEANASYLGEAQAELETRIPDWYGRASLSDRWELNRLVEGLAASTASVERLTRPMETFDHFLHDKADQILNKLLGLPAGSVDPDTVTITSPRETLTFTELLRDGYDDSLGLLKATADNHATFSGPPGINLSRLTPKNVTGAVRGQWVGDRYIEQLKTTSLDPNAQDYETFRANTLGIMKLQLQAAALTSQLKGHITGQQAQWLGISLGHLDDSSTTARSRFAVDPLRINLPIPKRYDPNNTRAETIDGVYVFTQPDADGRPERLIYTPNAPDGILFRDYERFTSSLKAKGMPTYYQQRASAGDRALAGLALDNLRRGSTLPALPTKHPQSIRDLFYNDALTRKVENVQESTVGRAERLRQVTLNSLELIATGLLLPLQAAVGLSAFRGIAAIGTLARTSIALDLLAIGSGSAITVKDTLKIANSLAQADNNAAGDHLQEAVLNGLSLLLDVYSLGTAVKPAKHLVGALKGADAVKALQSISLPPPPAGMHRVLLEGEQFWVNNHSNMLGHFELYRQGADATLTSAGQFAQRDLGGNWSRIGLRGGGKNQSKPAVEFISAKPKQPPEGLPSSRYPMASEQLKLPPGITAGWHAGDVVPSYVADINGRSVPVKYDFHTNTWRDGQSLPFQYNRATGRFRRVDLPEGAALSEAVQNRALADFGLDISLPLSVTPLNRALFKPIPRKIHSIWIGGAMPLQHIDQIRANARAAGNNVPPLEMTLYLSIADPKILGDIRSRLKNCPNLKLQILEETEFYKDFKTTKYFEQFKMESAGPAANQAAAVDTLRYQLIKHQGGIHMDVDDVIPSGGRAFPEAALCTGEGQLLLTEPVSSEIVGMTLQYNTSTFGSLAGNPTLEAMSEESYARFKANPDLFSSRPYKGKNTEDEMTNYISRISSVTGPGLFNDVIRKRLPAVHKYAILQRFLQSEFYLEPLERQAIKQSVLAFKDSLKPLDVEIGAAHSWMTQR